MIGTLIWLLLWGSFIILAPWWLWGPVLALVLLGAAE